MNSICGNISSCIFDWGLAFTSYCTRKIGDWLLSKSSFHARRGVANIYIFPKCQEMSIAEKSVPKRERGRLCWVLWSLVLFDPV